VKTAIYLALGVLTLIFSFIWFQTGAQTGRHTAQGRPSPTCFVGFVTIFLDTLGIGCFATISFLVQDLQDGFPDELIPGTMNIGRPRSPQSRKPGFI